MKKPNKKQPKELHTATAKHGHQPLEITPACEFKHYVDLWIKLLGVSGWVYVVRSCDLGIDKKSTKAMVVADVNGRSASFSYNTGFLEDVNSIPYTTQQLALHEVIHLLLWDLLEYAHDHGSGNPTTVGVEHSVIHRIASVILGDSK